jgi:hypothetical protein
MAKSRQNMATLSVSVASNLVTVTVTGIRQPVALAGITALTLLAALCIYLIF